MLVLWTPVLESFNVTNKSLRSVDIDLSLVILFYVNYILYVSEFRNNFDILLNEPMYVCKKDFFSNISKRNGRRTVFFNKGDAEETVFPGNEKKMKTETFIAIVNALIHSLNS